MKLGDWVVWLGLITSLLGFLSSITLVVAFQGFTVHNSIALIANVFFIGSFLNMLRDKRE